jgi:hypothetical protein
MLFDVPSSGSQRQMLTPAEVNAYANTGSLIVDDRRRRPLWFDGRFLAAKDLNQEQNYFLVRQSDLRRAGGWGVVSGLQVSQLTTSSTGANTNDTIQITAGEGVTPEGEFVSIPTDVHIDLSDIADQRQLNAAFGLSEIPTSPARSRTGLYVLGLRAVEYSANPIASYPTTLTGARSTQDGDTIEAAAIVLVPYPDSGTQAEMNSRRARVAREIFVTQSVKAIAADILPIAMVGLTNGFISWVDPWLVRREAGTDQLLLTVGSAGRATRRAFLLQYENQLQEVVRQAGQSGAGFAATDYFFALPPIGRMPAASIDPTNLVQKFFPQDINVILSVIPDDELPRLIEDSLSLPPIDLQQSSQGLSSISVYVLVPQSRATYASNHTALGTPALPPSVPADPSRRLPAEVLNLSNALKLQNSSLISRLGSRILLTNTLATPPPSTGTGSTVTWQSVFNNVSFVWFVRARSSAQPVTIGT